MSLKAIISIAGGAIGVGGIVAPVALWQTGYLGTTSQNSNPDSNTSDTTGRRGVPSLVSSSSISSSEGNCEVVDTIGEEIFRGLGVSKSDYTTVFCRNTNSRDTEKRIADSWTGLFPNDLLLLNEESFALRTKFNVETKTIETANDEEDEEYETTFIGNRFLYPPLVGKWGKQPTNISGKSITEVTVKEESEGSQKIYLVFPPKE